MAHDISRRVPIASVVGKKGVDERTFIRQLLATLQANSVVIDRGFPSYALTVRAVQAWRGMDLPMHMSINHTTTLKAFRSFITGIHKSANIHSEMKLYHERIQVQTQLVAQNIQRGRPRKETTKERMIIPSHANELLHDHINRRIQAWALVIPKAYLSITIGKSWIINKG